MDETCTDPRCGCHGNRHNCVVPRTNGEVGDEHVCPECSRVWIAEPMSDQDHRVQLFAVKGLVSMDSVVWVGKTP